MKKLLLISLLFFSTYIYANKPTYPYGEHLVFLEPGVVAWGVITSNNSAWITFLHAKPKKLNRSSKYYNVHRIYFSASCGSQLIQGKDQIFYYAKHTDLSGTQYPISSTHIHSITPPSYAVESMNVIPNTVSENIYNLICYGSPIPNFNHFR
ncbi:hypothetical protein JF634_06555 [Simonsiella muelleri]|uniref:Uncharacterized protein n=1 Tax=Simonsiella muelleri ATCC 29453 TaxID=641147 RepID=V9HBR1_9NEIS|nr:hypothetical protein [Simonsiella muelleri]EFG30650.1 hypothetical protein HMPREF9021_01620 [Simonsiella muelleri ATCC 29453]UBQ52894.1 hypothetical protein JF634_06555 [Simonsiella muelleri]